MRLSVIALMLLIGRSALAADLGVWVDLDASGNVVAIYASPQPTDQKAIWVAVTDPRIAAYFQARPGQSVPAGVPQQ